MISNPLSSNLSISRNALNQGLAKPDFWENIIFKQAGYTKNFPLLAMITQGLGKREPIRIKNGEFNVPFMADFSVRKGSIKSATVVGGVNLAIVWNEIDVPIVENDIVDCDTYQARVISKNNNGVVIEPHADNTGNAITTLVGTPFATANKTVVKIDRAVNYTGNRIQTGVNILPGFETYQSQVKAYCQTYNRRDWSNNWYTKNPSGNFEFANDNTLLFDYMRDLQSNFLLSTNIKKAEYSTSPGARTQLIQAGQWLQMSSLVNVEQYLIEAIMAIKKRNGYQTGHLIGYLGTDLMAAFQTQMAKYVINVGTGNTFGIVNGLNAMKYSILGYTIDFMGLPFADNDGLGAGVSSITGNNISSSWGFIFDTSDVVTSGKSMPWVQQYSYDSVIARYVCIKGIYSPEDLMSDTYGVVKGSNGVLPELETVSNDFDGFSTLIQSDGGFFLTDKYRHFFLTLAN